MSGLASQMVSSTRRAGKAITEGVVQPRSFCAHQSEGFLVSRRDVWMTYSDVPTLIAVVTFAADETSTSATHIARRSPADGAVVIGCHSSVPSSLPPHISLHLPTPPHLALQLLAGGKQRGRGRGLKGEAKERRRRGRGTSLFSMNVMFAAEIDLRTRAKGTGRLREGG